MCFPVTIHLTQAIKPWFTTATDCQQMAMRGYLAIDFTCPYVGEVGVTTTRTCTYLLLNQDLDRLSRDLDIKH